MLMICLPDYIALGLCEVVMSDQEYSIHDFSNFCDKMNLELLLHYGSLCDIRTERHAEAEIFVEVK